VRESAGYNTAMRLGPVALAVLLAGCTVDINLDLIKNDTVAGADHPGAGDRALGESKPLSDHRDERRPSADRRPTEGPGPCGPSSCNSGCCSSSQCVSGNDDDACGRGGTACADCTQKGEHCSGKQHQCN
jgi:hypothetical protein